MNPELGGSRPEGGDERHRGTDAGSAEDAEREGEDEDERERQDGASAGPADDGGEDAPVTASEHTTAGLVGALEAHFDLAQTGTRMVARN